MIDIKTEYRGMAIAIKDAGAKGFRFEITDDAGVTHTTKGRYHLCGEDALYVARTTIDWAREGIKGVLDGD